MLKALWIRLHIVRYLLVLENAYKNGVTQNWKDIYNKIRTRLNVECAKRNVSVRKNAMVLCYMTQRSYENWEEYF